MDSKRSAFYTHLLRSRKNLNIVVLCMSGVIRCRFFAALVCGCSLIADTQAWIREYNKGRIYVEGGNWNIFISTSSKQV